MNVILLLIFASLAMAVIFLLAFIWAVHSGQYEDTCTPSMRMLAEDPVAPEQRTAFPLKQNRNQP